MKHSLLLRIIRVVTVLLACTVAQVVVAQVSFQKFYPGSGGDRSLPVVAVMPNGGYVIAVNEDYVSADADIELVRTDQYGDTLWTRRIGSPTAHELVIDVTVNTNGEIGVATQIGFWAGPNPPWSDLVVIKLDASGNVLWDKVIDFSGSDEHAASIANTDDGGFVVGGVSAGYTVPFVVKFSALGTIEWLKKYIISGAQQVSRGQTIQCSNGDYALLFEYENAPATRTAVVVRLSPIGNVIWNKQYAAGSTRFGPAAMSECSNGDFVFTCSCNLPLGNVQQVAATRIAGNGTVLWSNVYYLSSFSSWMPQDISVTVSGDVVICGGINSSGDVDGFLMRLGANGAHQFSKVYGQTFATQLNCVNATPDDGCIVSGVHDTLSYNWCCYVVKTDYMGSSPCGSTSYTPYSVLGLTVTTVVLTITTDTVYSVAPWTYVEEPCTRRAVEPCPVGIDDQDLSQTGIVYYQQDRSVLNLKELKIGDLLCIYDLSGRLVKSETINTSAQEVYCTDLACGVYSYVVLGPHSAGIAGKFVKE